MSNLLAIPQQKHELTQEIKSMVVNNNFDQLSAEQRTSLVYAICSHMNLTPLTQPFSFIKMNGRTVLYATKDCANQLRNLHKLSVTATCGEIDRNGMIKVIARAENREGRFDEDLGVVYAGKMQGDALGNAMLKAMTKAKRRVTLSFCGMGFLDETEVQTVKTMEAEKKREIAPVIVPDVNRMKIIKDTQDMIQAVGFGQTAKLLKIKKSLLQEIWKDGSAGDWDFIELPKESLENIQFSFFCEVLNKTDWTAEFSDDPRTMEGLDRSMKVIDYMRKNALSENIEKIYAATMKKLGL